MDSPSNSKGLLREPLFIFFLIGAALFAVDALRSPGGEDTSFEIRVTEAQIDQLAAAWEGQSNRPPTEQELNGLIQSHITEEILMREAIALGLDQNDTIVRRRLAQKARFLLEDNIEIEGASEDDLEEFFQTNRSAYTIPAIFTFDHIYFSDSAKESELSTRLAGVREALSEDPPQDWRSLGDAFMLSRTIVRQPLKSIARTFGTDFSETLPSLETGSWVGPVTSGLGVHLIRIREKTEERIPEFPEVKGRVAQNYVAQARRSANIERMEDLRGQYTIVIERETEQ